MTSLVCTKGNNYKVNTHKNWLVLTRQGRAGSATVQPSYFIQSLKFSALGVCREIPRQSPQYSAVLYPRNKSLVLTLEATFASSVLIFKPRVCGDIRARSTLLTTLLMIDWCSVNGALQKTRECSCPGNSSISCSSRPGPRNIACIWSVAWRGGAEEEEHEYEFTRCFLWASGDGGWVSGCLHHPPRDPRAGGHTRVSSIINMQRGENITSCPRHWQLVSPGSGAASRHHLGRQIGSMTDGGSSRRSSDDI